MVRTPEPETVPPFQVWPTEEPTMRFEPAFGRAIVPELLTVWIVSTPPRESVAPAETVTADASGMRSLPVVASVPALTAVAPP